MQRQTADARARKVVALMVLAENFGKTFSDALLKTWLELLSGYTVRQVEQACRCVIEKYEYKTIPPFAVLKKYLDGAGGVHAESLTALKAQEEWALLLELVRRYGYGEEPALHPTTSAVIRSLGGWQAACAWLEGELPYRRRDFLSLWEMMDGKAGLMGEGAAVLQAALESGNVRGPRTLPSFSDPKRVNASRILSDMSKSDA